MLGVLARLAAAEVRSRKFRSFCIRRASFSIFRTCKSRGGAAEWVTVRMVEAESLNHCRNYLWQETNTSIMDCSGLQGASALLPDSALTRGRSVVSARAESSVDSNRLCSSAGVGGRTSRESGP